MIRVIQWIIICTFGLTAIISILSITDLIKIADEYKSKLFNTMIIGVISLCISNVTTFQQDRINESLNDFIGMPLDWQYAEKAWRCRGNFIKIGGTSSDLYIFKAETFWRNPSDSIEYKVASFESVDTFNIESERNKIKFEAIQYYEPDVLKQDHRLLYEIGRNKARRGTIILNRDQCLEGNFTPSKGGTGNWGIIFNRVK